MHHVCCCLKRAILPCVTSRACNGWLLGKVHAVGIHSLDARELRYEEANCYDTHVAYIYTVLSGFRCRGSRASDARHLLGSQRSVPWDDSSRRASGFYSIIYITGTPFHRKKGQVRVEPSCRAPFRLCGCVLCQRKPTGLG